MLRGPHQRAVTDMQHRHSVGSDSQHGFVRHPRIPQSYSLADTMLARMSRLGTVYST